MFGFPSNLPSVIDPLGHRWATEDPNPTSKVAEKRRLEDMGREAIQAKLDPRMVDAVRSIRALEDGEEVPIGLEDDDTYDDEVDENEDGSRKRRRIEAVYDDEQNQMPSPPESPPPQASGLLTAETMQGLKYFAQLRQARGGQDTPPSTASSTQAAPARALGGLGDYGSDEESD